MESEEALYELLEIEYDKQYKKPLLKKNNNVCYLCNSPTVSHFSDNCHDDYVVCSNVNCGVLCDMNLDISAQTTFSGPSSGYYGESSLGTKIACSRYSDIKRLHDWHIKTNKERSRNRVAQDIENVGKKHMISKPILENAYNLYDKIIDRRYKEWQTNPEIRRRINRKGLIASLLIISSQIQQKPIDYTTVAEICAVDMKQVIRSMKTFNELLSREDIYYSLKKSTSSQFVKVYCTNMKVPEHLADKAVLIADNLEKSQLVSDHQPPSLAVTAILLMAERNNYPLSRKEIKKHVKISEPTINKIYKKVEPYIRIMEDEEISKEFISELYMSAFASHADENPSMALGGDTDDSLNSMEDEDEDDDDVL